ncbi:MAG: hypothetical protein H6709_01355 [Kofleriaceae bacterium]|nr:hypothetical protein [Myxococcales bacterium]MCB9560794.1 hypothetical protein [Kofleriaceae bacterium]MCB9570716.1 hypothetical protein [Kofleriaceae bacterium]
MSAPSVCRIAALTVGFCFLATAAADAGPKSKKKKKKDTDIADVSAFKDKLVVFTDGEGDYFAAVPGDMDTLFYGDGKTFYKQRAFSGGRNGTKWSMRMWSPRVDHVADLDGDVGKGTMTCGKDKTELTQVPDAEAAKILDKATFRLPFWKRQAHALSRDDRGIYYYVDQLRDEYGGKDYKLYAGPKGAMKELGLTNIVSDSEGEIFASKKGELRFIQDRSKATWIKGEKRVELVQVPLENNLPMIYGELGVYEGSLGTPCDEY